ncbi:MAG: hypothetical protein RLY65_1323 [Pseudomonadota bacterium]
MQTMREISLIEGPKPGDVEATRTEKPAPRLIAHLDMDAFFASVELLRFPQLQGLALVVGGRSKTIMQQMQQLQAQYGALESIAVAQMPRLRQYQGRGVITTASYAARAFGIGSGMGLMKAATRCPDAILLAADFERYREYSRRFKAVIRDQGLSLEDRGIDEVYIDLSHCASLEQAQALSRQLQSSIFEATRLSCSIGLAPNKLLAKIASDLRKPKGLSILTHASIEEQLWPLPVSRLHGVGPRTALSILSGLSVDDLAQAVAAQESAMLTRVPGIGKKTAERLLLELRGKFAGSRQSGQSKAPTDDLLEVQRALIALGYSEKESAIATQAISPGSSVSDGIRQALKQLSRGAVR